MCLLLLLKKSSMTSSKLENMSANSAKGFGKLNFSILMGDASVSSLTVSSTVHCFSAPPFFTHNADGDDAVGLQAGTNAEDDATDATTATRLSAEDVDRMVEMHYAYYSYLIVTAKEEVMIIMVVLLSFASGAKSKEGGERCQRGL